MEAVPLILLLLGDQPSISSLALIKRVKIELEGPTKALFVAALLAAPLCAQDTASTRDE